MEETYLEQRQRELIEERLNNSASRFMPGMMVKIKQDYEPYADSHIKMGVAYKVTSVDTRNNVIELDVKTEYRTLWAASSFEPC